MSGEPIVRLKSEPRLTAVVLADSYSSIPKFRPFTDEIPKVLMPLANVPMIEYTLEFLANNGVQDIIIIASVHSDKIQTYIENTRWKHRKPEINVYVRTSEESKCVGDALRFIEAEKLIEDRQDFILIPGDVITNVDLKAALAAHKKNRALATKGDVSELLLTLVFSEASPVHAMRSIEDDLIVAIDSLDNELLFYDDNVRESTIVMEPSIMENRKAVTVRSDLLDTNIMICTCELLDEFRDNFDYAGIQTNLFRAVLRKDENDISSFRVYSYIAKRLYAAQVRDLRTYHTITHDIMRRWTYPTVPDKNILSDTTYSFYKNNVYREKGVDIHRTTKIESDCIIATNVKIGQDTTLNKTIIGRNTIIGEKVTLCTSYIWNDVIIEDGCIIDGAIIASGAHIKAGTKIFKGTLIGPKVTIGSNITIPPYCAITALPSRTSEELLAIDNCQRNEKEYGIQPPSPRDESETGTDRNISMISLTSTFSDMHIGHYGDEEEEDNSTKYWERMKHRPDLDAILKNVASKPYFLSDQRLATLTGIVPPTSSEQATSIPSTAVHNPPAPTIEESSPIPASTLPKDPIDGSFTSVLRAKEAPEDDTLQPITLDLSSFLASSSSSMLELGSYLYGIKFNPFDSLTNLSKIADKDVVGNDGVGRLYMREEHSHFGSLGHIINSITPMDQATSSRIRNPPALADLYDFAEVIPEVEEEEHETRFFNEIHATLVRGTNGGMKVEDISMELVSLKFGSNMNVDWYIAAVLCSFFRLANFPPPTCLPSGESAPPPPVDFTNFKITSKEIQAFKSILSMWSPCISKFCRSNDDQANHVLPGLIGGVLMNEEAYSPMFPLIIEELYNLKVLTAHAIVEFYQTRLMRIISLKKGTYNTENDSNFTIDPVGEQKALNLVRNLVVRLQQEDDDDEDYEDEDEYEDEEE